MRKITLLMYMLVSPVCILPAGCEQRSGPVSVLPASIERLMEQTAKAIAEWDVNHGPGSFTSKVLAFRDGDVDQVTNEFREFIRSSGLARLIREVRNGDELASVDEANYASKTIQDPGLVAAVRCLPFLPLVVNESKAPDDVMDAALDAIAMHRVQLALVPSAIKYSGGYSMAAAMRDLRLSKALPLLDMWDLIAAGVDPEIVRQAGAKLTTLTPPLLTQRFIDLSEKDVWAGFGAEKDKPLKPEERVALRTYYAVMRSGVSQRVGYKPPTCDESVVELLRKVEQRTDIDPFLTYGNITLAAEQDTAFVLVDAAMRMIVAKDQVLDGERLKPLPELRDPFSGITVRFTAGAGKRTIYSTGIDGVDNAGIASPGKRFAGASQDRSESEGLDIAITFD
ncbi:MAG: hypothetical protein HEQ23_06080 [Tepidisphaera sp.]